MLLSSCANGTYLSPIVVPSTLNESKTNATVFFYRSNDLCGSIDVSGDKIIVVDFKPRADLPEDDEEYRGKDYFEKDEILVSNRKVYSSLDIASGIHTFSFLGMYKQTVRLAGNSYYLAVNFTCVPGFLYQPIFSLEFRTKEAFIKDTKDMALVRITKGFKLNTIFKTYRYEVIQRPD